MANRNDFEGRLLSILEPRRARPRSRWATAGVALLLLAMIGGLAAMTAPNLEGDAADMRGASSDPGRRGGGGNERAVTALTAMLADTDAGVRGSAAEALGDLCARSAGPALTALLDDPEPAVRARAARALGEIGHAPAVERLARTVRFDPDPDVAKRALDALAEIGTDEAWHVLDAALRSGDAKVRKLAIRAIGRGR
jgi:vesicle coat complex subunit